MRQAKREVKDNKELTAIIEACDVCRVAFSDGEYPYIVPLSFGYEYGDTLTLYFHCAKEGKKLDLMRLNPKVGFEMDCSHTLITGPAACNYSMNFESIIGVGTLSEVTEPAEKARALDTIMRHYGFPGQPEYNPSVFERTAVLKLQVLSFTGKRLDK